MLNDKFLGGMNIINLIHIGVSVSIIEIIKYVNNMVGMELTVDCY